MRINTLDKTCEHDESALLKRIARFLIRKLTLFGIVLFPQNPDWVIRLRDIIRLQLTGLIRQVSLEHYVLEQDIKDTETIFHSEITFFGSRVRPTGTRQ